MFSTSWLDGISKGGDIEVDVEGMVRSKPGSVKDMEDIFGQEPPHFCGVKVLM